MITITIAESNESPQEPMGIPVFDPPNPHMDNEMNIPGLDEAKEEDFNMDMGTDEALSLASPHTTVMRIDAADGKPQEENLVGKEGADEGVEVILDLTLPTDMSPEQQQEINTEAADKSIKKRKRSDIQEYNISAEPGEYIVKTVARKIESIISTSRPDKEKALRHELDYSPYDVDFLKKLSVELHLNIDDAICTRGRPTRIGVMNHIIEKLMM
jgi:hypothetical protein